MSFFAAENMTVGYGRTAIIKDICFDLQRGRILTLIGPNGSGKTTILKSITAQLDMLGGCAYIDGSSVAAMKKTELATKMSVMLTRSESDELMTVYEFVSAGRYPYTGRFNRLNEHDREVVAESMRLTDIEELKSRSIVTVSDGQRQRAVLARALCQEPQLLVLDEPTSYLDIKYKLSFLSLVQKLSREKKIGVILSLHELDLAQRISDKIACVKGDRIDGYGTPEEIFKGDFITRLYDIDVGSYSPHSSETELKKPYGNADVFVIAGAGFGTEAFRSLQREGRAFSVGIIFENDIDFFPARALASEVISVESFGEISDIHIAKAKAIIDSCSDVICAIPREKMTGSARRLTELADYAESKIKGR